MRYRSLKISVSRKNGMIAVLLTAMSMVYGCGDVSVPSPANGGSKKLPSVLASASPKVPGATNGLSDPGVSSPTASSSGVPASTMPSGGFSPGSPLFVAPSASVTPTAKFSGVVHIEDVPISQESRDAITGLQVSLDTGVDRFMNPPLKERYTCFENVQPAKEGGDFKRYYAVLNVSTPPALPMFAVYAGNVEPGRNGIGTTSGAAVILMRNNGAFNATNDGNGTPRTESDACYKDPNSSPECQLSFLKIFQYKTFEKEERIYRGYNDLDIPVTIFRKVSTTICDKAFFTIEDGEEPALVAKGLNESIQSDTGWEKKKIDFCKSVGTDPRKCEVFTQ